MTETLSKHPILLLKHNIPTPKEKNQMHMHVTLQNLLQALISLFFMRFDTYCKKYPVLTMEKKK